MLVFGMDFYCFMKRYFIIFEKPGEFCKFVVDKRKLVVTLKKAMKNTKN